MTQYLKNFIIAETHRDDEMRSVLRDVYDARLFEARSPEDFFAEGAYFDLGAVDLSCCYYSTPVRIAFRDDDYIRIQIALSGSSRTTIAGRPVEANGRTIVCSPAGGMFEFGPSFEQLVLRINQEALEADITEILGKRPTKKLSFELGAECDAGLTQGLRELIISSSSIIDGWNGHAPRPLLREMDQMLRHSVLYGIPNNLSYLLYDDLQVASPWQVKRVEEWIDAHWREDVTIEKLVQVTGVSGRSIFAAFKSSRSYTPMRYLKYVRLNAARDMLQRAEAHISVTSVSFMCNFMSPSKFAREYQAQFGESPSDTLRRARGRL